MKKSAALILSLAMAFSMYSSAAFAAASGTKSATTTGVKSIADFTDLQQLDAAAKAKFEAMIAAGVYNGLTDDTFGLKEKMNRAQFAKVAALIFGLDVDMSLKSSSFKDVTAQDPANGYALPYIEAIVKAGITDGVAPGMYDPAGEVTKEQLAAFLIRGLGLESQVKAPAEKADKTISDWARGYVALAIEKKLLSNGEDGIFGGTSFALREQLVLASYEAKQQFKPVFTGNYAIASLKATDVNVLTVELNGAVEDPKEVKLDITKNGAALTGGFTTKWSEDKRTAVLAFDSKLDAAEWTVTLGGLSKLDEEKKTAKLKTDKEKISKLEFVTAGDMMPNSPGKKLRVEFKATNQYGTQFSSPASDFTIYTSSGTAAPIGGEQAFYVTPGEGLNRGATVSISILHSASGSQANKVFTVGEQQLISKLELGEMVNGSGQKVTTLDAKGFAYLDVKAYDQYGFRVEDRNDLNSGITVTTTDIDLEKGNPGEVGGFVENAVGDSGADLKIRSVGDKSKDVKISLVAHGSGQSVEKSIAIVAAGVPASVQFGAYNQTLAKGDVVTGDDAVDAKMYVPIIVKDAQGNVLTAQQIYDNRDKFMVMASGGVTLADQPISGSGKYKGMIALKNATAVSPVTLTVQLKDYPQGMVQANLAVKEERKANAIRFAQTPKNYMTAGAENELKVKLYDQYGEELKYDTNKQYLVRFALTANTGDAATLAATSLSSKQRVEPNPASGRKYVLQPTTLGSTVIHDFMLAQNSSDLSVDSVFDKAFVFTAGPNAKSASYTMKATLYKESTAGVTVNGKTYAEVNSLSTTMEVIDAADTSQKLAYEVYMDSPNQTLLAAHDYFAAGLGATGAVNVFDHYKGFAKQVKVRAKKSSGEEVQVPSNIVSVSSTDTQVADTAGLSADADGLRYVAGGKAGAAKLTVVYRVGGGNMQTATLDVTAKNEGPAVSGMTLQSTAKTVSASDLTNGGSGLYMWDAKLAEKIVVKDQFGDEFTAVNAPGSLDEEGHLNEQGLVKAPAQAGYNTNELLKLSFFVSDITGANPAAITVDAKTGLVKYTGAAGDVTSFKLNVLAPSGVKASFDVTVK
ncbi:S-layer homology domain-containing protein [Paenibacillus sp. GD4]|uniref:S-layer homology domain-containing protein n=1 Tax=Paenibacillus sp. GD4 TaxID=3068890 RepID=UPI002796E130|nr:S-layer homology domain-containing protein [Paenibacillus sp. GD4]MDQ1909627.1 S-layer homology domain-containing protein [Paenibacillus sp. GD4]